MSSAAITRPGRMEAVPHHPKGALIGSVLFHVLIVLLVIFGIPFVHKTPPPEPTAMSVDLVNPNQVTSAHPPTHVKAPPTPKPPTPKPVPPQPPPPQVTPAQPPEPTPPVKPDEPKPLDAPKPDDLALPKKETVKPPPKPKQQPDKAATKQQQDDFNSLLKNLVPAPAPEAAAPDTPDKSDKTTPDASAAALGSSELAAFVRQLGECWKLMGGAPDAQNLDVDLRLSINSDRTLRDAHVVDTQRYSNDPYFRATADSAMRAVHDPHCNQFELPPDKYNQWKDITVTFDPNEMLQ